MGGDGRGQSTQDINPPPYSPLLHGNSKNTNATLECLPLAAERRTRNLQNFFPSLRLLEEEREENLKLVEEDLDDWGSKHLVDCLPGAD